MHHNNQQAVQDVQQDIQTLIQRYKDIALARKRVLKYLKETYPHLTHISDGETFYAGPPSPNSNSKATQKLLATNGWIFTLATNASSQAQIKQANEEMLKHGRRLTTAEKKKPTLKPKTNRFGI